MDSYEIDKKLQPVLREMEKNGVKLDVDFLNQLNQKVSLHLLKIEEEIYQIIDHKFNLNSPKQLAEVLYKKLKINPRQSGVKRKKTHHSTSAENLIKIKKLHPAINLILKYRELFKLKTTYLDPLPKMVDKYGRLHTTYAIDTASGRLSSKSPNLQNIPTSVKDNEYFEIRRAFISENGYKIIAADYSQIELRIAAHFSGDKNMLEIFSHGKDIHSATAQELGIDRKTAKTVNFSILYGVSAYGLSETLEIPVEEAQILIDKYFLAFPRLKEYISEIISLAAKQGYVKTLFGRKRYIPELHSPIQRIRKFGERVAINTPFQGTAADIIKLAMLILKSKIKNQSAKMILQVHDELVFEVKENKVEYFSNIIRDAMENAVKLSIPILVDISVGSSWGELR